MLVERDARHGILVAFECGEAARLHQTPHLDRLVGRPADEVLVAELQTQNVTDVPSECVRAVSRPNTPDLEGVVVGAAHHLLHVHLAKKKTDTQI